MKKIEMLIKTDGKIYEIGELVTSVNYEDRLNDGCSKLEFSYINENLMISNGANVWYTYDGVKIFCGFVFKRTVNSDKLVTVVAYDQLRYCKAKDEIVCVGDTATSLVKRMCNYFKLNKGTISNTGYKLATSVQDGKTWLDIIYESIGETLQNTGRKYCLRDEFGKIALRDLNDLRLNIILGDNSLAYDFEYEKSIDEETYNRVKVYIKGDDEGTAGKFVNVQSDTSIQKYGLLQYFESVENGTNEAQVISKAKELLKLYNREYETLSLECIGDTSIRAGSSFYVYIGDIKLNKQLYVVSVSHSFLPNHTMSIEVAI